MGSIQVFFQPPLHWQQFEELTKGVFPYDFGDPNPQIVGRPGQAQDGVDVFGRHSISNKWVGIQCKRMDELDVNNQPLPGGVITKQFLRDAYDEALKFKPDLGIWVLATTAKRDAKIQKEARTLDDESVAKGKFRVHVWFWDDYVSTLNKHYDLQNQYYANVIQIRSPDDQDQVILELFREAFSRPAFQDPIIYENGDDFLQAISDTKLAMNMGRLLDRITRAPIRQAIGGKQCISQQTIKDRVNDSYEGLRQLSDSIKKGLKDGNIVNHGGFLGMDGALSQKLEGIRGQTVAHLNAALVAANLPPL